MDTIEKAALLFGKGQQANQGAAHSANVTTITGVATSDSVDGTVTVDVGGTTISYDDNQSVELPTTCDVREGDTVQIKVAGSDGSAKSLMVDGVVAGGDRTKTEIDAIAVKQIETDKLLAKKAEIQDLQAANAAIENLSAQKADVTALNAATAKITSLETNKANVADLNAANAAISKLRTDKANITDLNATNAAVNQLKTNKADITALNASNANIATLQALSATIETLLSNRIFAGQAQIGSLTAEQLSTVSGWITSAMIASLTADKITSGAIDTSKVQIASADGGLTIAGPTLQIADHNHTVRLQLGRDAQGHFTFVLFDETGQGTLIDAAGIHPGAVPDGLIVDKMVAGDAAIAGSKLDIDSVVDRLNADGTKTINMAKIYLDADNGTLSEMLARVESDGGFATVNQITKTADGIQSTVSKTMANIATKYYQSASATALTGGSWQDTAPAWTAGKYIWQKNIITYQDGATKETTPVCIQGAKGDTGAAGTSVKVSSIQYQAGASATTAPTGTWSNAVVSAAEGQYLWTKTTFSDGNIAYGVAKQGTLEGELITNGRGEFGDNTNFPEATFDSTQYVEGSYGSFISSLTHIYSTELIPIDRTKDYVAEVYAKKLNDSDSSLHYFGFSFFDVDKKQIIPGFEHYIVGSTTTLAQDLKNGDNKVYLTSTAGFIVTSSTPSYKLGLIFWNYKDSTGFQYPSETYSRNIWDNLYDYTSFDKTNNVITLKSPWSYGFIPKGTSLSQSSSGSTYEYLFSTRDLATDSWTRYKAIYSGSLSFKYYSSLSNNIRSYARYIRPVIIQTASDKKIMVTKLSLKSIDSMPVGNGSNLVTGSDTLSVDSTGTVANRKWRISGTTSQGSVETVALSDSPVSGVNSGCRVKRLSGSSQYGIVQDSGKVIAYNAYTMSCWVKPSRAGIVVRLQAIWSSSNQLGGRYYTLKEGWQRIHHTVIATTSGSVSLGYIYLNGEESAEDYIDLCAIKVEEGYHATDWTLSPGDVQADIDNAKSTADTASTGVNELKDTTTAMQTQIEHNDNAISETTIGIAKNEEDVQELYSQMNATNADLTDVITAQSEFSQTVDGLNASVTRLQGDVNDTAAALKPVTEWMRFDETGMAIGNSDSGRKVKINEQAVEFDNAAGEAVARFAEKAEIHDLEIADGGTFTMGNWAWIPRSNGNLSLKWIGGH